MLSGNLSPTANCVHAAAQLSWPERHSSCRFELPTPPARRASSSLVGQAQVVRHRDGPVHPVGGYFRIVAVALGDEAGATALVGAPFNRVTCCESRLAPTWVRACAELAREYRECEIVELSRSGALGV